MRNPLNSERLQRVLGAGSKVLPVGPAAQRGLAFGLVVAIVSFQAFVITTKATPAGSLAVLLLVAAARLAQALVLAFVLLQLGSLAHRLPRLPQALLVTLALSVLVEYLGVPLPGVLLLIAIVGIPAALVGAGVAALIASRSPGSTRLRLATAALATILGVGVGVGGGRWLLGDGHAVEMPAIAALRAPAPLPAAGLGDPSRPGPYKVATLTYGPGGDRWRPEFSSAVAMPARRVDGRTLVEEGAGFGRWWRRRFWGFDLAHLPLQARVWHPQGEGPFPLVLAVHGSHPMDDFSDPGYGYLGEVLASRGFVFASVDENFLNTSDADSAFFPWSDGRLRGEVDLRAWLLLEHLRQWREWNATPGGRFHGQIDLGRIALVGHSKGGEAVAIAASLNRLAFLPDDSRVRLDYGFGIRSVVAIAPTDGLYRPGGLPTRLEDVDYLTLQGSNDMDVQSFVGGRQFSRVAFSGRGYFMKEAVYVWGANHGQFNTVWGRVDYSRARTPLFNRKPLLSGEDQRRIAAVFVDAFLEASLHERRGYLSFLRDYRTGIDWLPRTILLTQFEDSETRVLGSFDEDVDLTTATLRGAAISGTALDLWREGPVKIKWGTRDTNAVQLGWDRSHAAGTPSYSIALPQPPPATDASSVLVFSAADIDGTPGPEAVDFSIELVDSSGASARLALGSASYLQPMPRVAVAKAAVFGDAAPCEPVFQSFELPLAAFVRANPALDPARLRSVRFLFDRTPRRTIALDDVGFRTAAGPAAGRAVH